MSRWSELEQIRIGLKFLSGFLTPRSWGLVDLETFLDSSLFPKKKYRMRVFTPKNFHKNKTNAILLLHGMSAKGIDDPRILNLGTSLAKTGFQVFIPELEEVKKLLIQKETIENIYDLAISLVQNKFNFAWKNLGFFSISFTGGIGLISMARKDLSEIKSIVVVGPYSNFSTTLPYVLEHYEKDTYGSYVFLYNFIHKIVENPKDLENIFFEAALDNGLQRKGTDAQAEKLRHNLKLRDREIFEKFSSSADYRKEIGKKIRANMDSFIESLSPINYIDQIACPVTIVHGKNDYVISELESIEIAKRLKQKGLNHLLEITGLLSHGDAVPFYKQIPNIYGFARAFGYFFKNIQV